MTCALCCQCWIMTMAEGIPAKARVRKNVSCCLASLAVCSVHQGGLFRDKQMYTETYRCADTPENTKHCYVKWPSNVEAVWECERKSQRIKRLSLFIEAIFLLNQFYITGLSFYGQRWNNGRNLIYEIIVINIPMYAQSHIRSIQQFWFES